MADVIALPTAAAVPPPSVRRRGRLPRGVVSISRARRKREVDRIREEEDLAQSVQDRSKLIATLFMGLRCHAFEKNIRGALVIYEEADGGWKTIAAGTLKVTENATEALQAFLEDPPQWDVED